MHESSNQSRRAPFTRTEALLVAVIGLLAADFVRDSGMAAPRAAEAQVSTSSAGDPGGTRRETEPVAFINPAKQRQDIIEALRQLNQTVSRVDNTIKGGLEVRLPPSEGD